MHPPLLLFHFFSQIIPPENWKARKSGYEDINVEIPIPTVQKIKPFGIADAYQMSFIRNAPAMMSKDFKAMFENNPALSAPEYWCSLEGKTFPRIYGDDVDKSLFDDDCEGCNLKMLGDTIHKKKEMKGVNKSFLYFGSAGTSFAWHTEDYDMFSISYLHDGQPKTWYSVPQYEAKKLERLQRTIFKCPQYLRHKSTIINPHRLRLNGIPVYETTQHVNEFIITFPYGYHSGFNHGYNCAEAINFVTRGWIPFGIHAKMCPRNCRKLPFLLDLDTYVKEYYPGTSLHLKSISVSN